MCAIVGVINSENAAKKAYYGLFSMQHRGQESSGISASFNHHIKTIKSFGQSLLLTMVLMMLLM